MGDNPAPWGEGHMFAWAFLFKATWILQTCFACSPRAVGEAQLEREDGQQGCFG